MLIDANVLITSPEGEEQTAEIPKGAAIWFEEGTHKAVNVGNEESKLVLVYLKE